MLRQSSYEHTSSHTGQSLPHISRCGPKRLEQVIDAGRERRRRPRLPASVTRPGELADHGRSRARARRFACFQRVEIAGGDRRLRAVIEHHGEIRIPRGELAQRGQVSAAAPARRTPGHDRSSLRRPGASSCRSIQSGSGMSWIMGRRPTSCGSLGELARWSSAASALSKSTQPTTPAMNECSRASSSRKRVSVDRGRGLHERWWRRHRRAPAAAPGPRAGSPGR